MSEKQTDLTIGITPLPWRLLGDTPNVVGHDDEYVCGNSRGGNVRKFIDVGSRNMAYIVRACNAFPKLVDALDRIANGQWPVEIAETEGTLAMREVARAALKLAEGGAK